MWLERKRYDIVIKIWNGLLFISDVLRFRRAEGIYKLSVGSLFRYSAKGTPAARPVRKARGSPEETAELPIFLRLAHSIPYLRSSQ